MKRKRNANETKIPSSSKGKKALKSVPASTSTASTSTASTSTASTSTASTSTASTSTASAMKGKKSGPLPSILKAIKKYSNSKFTVVMVDEYLTSQICNTCKQRSLENLVDQQSKRRVHSVLKCKTTTCNTVWNRDIMAAKNILDVFVHASNNNNDRLTPFKRSEAST